MVQVAILGEKCLLGGHKKLSAAKKYGYEKSISVEFGLYGEQDFIWNLLFSMPQYLRSNIQYHLADLKASYCIS